MDNFSGHECHFKKIATAMTMYWYSGSVTHQCDRPVAVTVVEIVNKVTSITNTSPIDLTELRLIHAYLICFVPLSQI